MSPELMGILAVGGALAGLIWQMVRALDVRLNAKIDALAKDHQDLRERLARIEARIEVWLEVLLGRLRNDDVPAPDHPTTPRHA